MYRPWTTRRFGVEMEMRAFTTTRTTVSEAMLRRAVTDGLVGTNGQMNQRAASYWHSDGTTWDVKTDGSCGWEISTPALTLDDAGHNEEMRRVCERLQRDVTPSVDRQCGLHVHVECADFDWSDLQKLVALWVRYEPFFYEMVPLSRRTNAYCAPLFRHAWSAPSGSYFDRTRRLLTATTQRSFDREGQTFNRTMGLNILGWWRHRRVEFRLHSGTIDYEKIRHWVMVVTSLVNRVKVSGMAPPRVMRDFTADWVVAPTGYSTEYVAKALGLAPTPAMPAAEIPAESAELVTWIDARRTLFQRRRATA